MLTPIDSGTGGVSRAWIVILRSLLQLYQREPQALFDKTAGRIQDHGERGMSLHTRG